MILSRENIRRINLMDPFDEKRLGNASYDLAIDKIITMDGQEKNGDYKIKSQEMVWVISKEKFNMPKNLLGIAHVKTELTREGILSMNTGIIDPGYNGYISTLLINFGKAAKSISQGTIVLRIVFQEVEMGDAESTGLDFCINYQDYFRTIKKSTDNFDKMN